MVHLESLQPLPTTTRGRASALTASPAVVSICEAIRNLPRRRSPTAPASCDVAPIRFKRGIFHRWRAATVALALCGIRA